MEWGYGPKLANQRARSGACRKTGQWPITKLRTQHANQGNKAGTLDFAATDCIQPRPPFITAKCPRFPASTASDYINSQSPTLPVRLLGLPFLVLAFLRIPVFPALPFPSFRPVGSSPLPLLGLSPFRSSPPFLFLPPYYLFRGSPLK